MEVQSPDGVAVLEDCIGFSLTRTISKVEEKLKKGVLPDSQDDDIIPRVGDEMGAGKFPSMVSTFTLASYLLEWVFLGRDKIRSSCKTYRENSKALELKEKGKKVFPRYIVLEEHQVDHMNDYGEK